MPGIRESANTIISASGMKRLRFTSRSIRPNNQETSEGLSQVPERQGPPNQRNVIGNETVHAHVEELVCEGWLVDGIDPHAQAAFVSTLDDVLRDVAVPDGDPGAAFLQLIEPSTIQFLGDSQRLPAVRKD